MAKSPYDQQVEAMEDVFGSKRDVAMSEITAEDLDAWGNLAEGYGLSGANVTRIKKLVAGEYATRIGGINAEERMFFANVRRAEAERKAQQKRNTWTTLGTIGGMGLAAVLTLPTGGLSAGLFPALASTLGQFGGAAGSLAAGGDEYTAAGMVGAADAYGSYQFRQEIKKLTDEVHGLYEAADGYGQPDTATEFNWSNAG